PTALGCRITSAPRLSRCVRRTNQMARPQTPTIRPNVTWETPASTWTDVIDRYVSFLQVPTWRASVKRDGSERAACLSPEQAESLGQRMRKVIDRLALRRGQSVTRGIPSRRDLDDLWNLQGREVARAERCPTNLQAHFQRALLLNEAGYACVYCGRTAWGVLAEQTHAAPRTLR